MKKYLAVFIPFALGIIGVALVAYELLNPVSIYFLGVLTGMLLMFLGLDKN